MIELYVIMERYYKRKAQDTIDANRTSCPDEINWDEEGRNEES